MPLSSRPPSLFVNREAVATRAGHVRARREGRAQPEALTSRDGRVYRGDTGASVTFADVVAGTLFAFVLSIAAVLKADWGSGAGSIVLKPTARSPTCR